MNQRDQELLDKQMQKFSLPPRHEGIMIVMVVVAFFSGITLGDVLFTRQAVPVRVASSNVASAILSNGALQTMPR
jgi:hypothetical protein